MDHNIKEEMSFACSENNIPNNVLTNNPRKVVYIKLYIL